MVYSCLLNECKNRSNHPNCQSMSWHRLPTQNALDALRRILTTIKAYHRICSDCMKKVPSQRHNLNRCASTVAVTMDTAFHHHRFTRKELLNAVAHDHTYCIPTDKASTCLTPLSNVDVSVPSVAVGTSLALLPVILPP